MDCDPGSANSPPLRASGGYPPTVPVQNTTEPVHLLDLFNIFNVPTRQRLAMILDELGIGTAGEGQDFNEIVRRANPALAYARQALSVLVAQKPQLATILDATSKLVGQAAGHTASLRRFLDNSASLTELTAAHRGALAQAIKRLPALLASARPALAQLDAVAVDGTPLVGEIHAAVPSLNTLADRLRPFVATAKPALAKLGIATHADPAIRDATPLVGTIERYLRQSLPTTEQIGTVFSNLQRHGFRENFLSLVYVPGGAHGTLRLDRSSRGGLPDQPRQRPLQPICDDARRGMQRALRRGARVHAEPISEHGPRARALRPGRNRVADIAGPRQLPAQMRATRKRRVSCSTTRS